MTTFFFFSAKATDANGPAAAKVSPAPVVLRKSRLEVSQQPKTSMRGVFFMARMVTEYQLLTSSFVNYCEAFSVGERKTLANPMKARRLP